MSTPASRPTGRPLTGWLAVGTVGARAADGGQPDEIEAQWRRISEVGRRDGHAVGVCEACGERISVAVEPPISRGPRKGEPRGPWPECRICHVGRVIPSPAALEGVTPRMVPKIPRVPPLHGPPLPRLPYPGVDDEEAVARRAESYADELEGWAT